MFCYRIKLEVCSAAKVLLRKLYMKWEDQAGASTMVCRQSRLVTDPCLSISQDCQREERTTPIYKYNYQSIKILNLNRKFINTNSGHESI